MPAVNSKIVKADYNDIRNKLVSVLGDGGVTLGWGQQARIVSSAVDESKSVTINEWANLRYDIINAYKHINGSDPTTAVATEGSTIRYTSSFTPDTGALDVPQKQYDDWANNIIANRFTLAVGESATTAFVTNSKTNSWNGTISCTIGFYWASAAEARYWFNSGGRIRFATSRTGGTTSNQNTSWTSLCATMGTVEFGGNTPGTGTTPSDGFNWYRCTNTFQTFQTFTASSPYGSNRIELQARVGDVANNNTGTASYGEIRILFIDGYVDPVLVASGGKPFAPDASLYPPDDLVDGTLSVACNLRYATGIMVPSSATFAVVNPTVGVGGFTDSYTPPAADQTFSPSTFFDPLVNHLRGFLPEYRNFNFYFYQLDGPASPPEKTFIADGGSDMFDTGNFTLPQGPFNFDSRYVSGGSSSVQSGDIAIDYLAARDTTLVYDGNLYYRTFGWGGGNNVTSGTVTQPVTNTGSLAWLPKLQEAANYPESRPLTAFAYRTGSNQTIGLGKIGNLGADGAGTLVHDFVYLNQTVNTFNVVAWRRQVYNTGDPSVCDLYMLIGHPRWNSVYGVTTWTTSGSTDLQNASLKMDGTTNVIAVVMLLSKATGVQVTGPDCEIVVQQLTARMKSYFYF